jgi:cytochrome c peroxidase
MHIKKLVFCLMALAILAYACSPDDETALKEAYPELPAIPYPYKVGTNDHIPTLGRVLFYDKQLSINNSVSCSSCHKQELAFADNVRFSRGFENRLTTRNSMPIQNLRLGFDDSLGLVKRGVNPLVSSSFVPFGANFLFWDGRETSLKSMVLKPIGNHVEMGIRKMDGLTQKLSTVPYYKELFKKAYGTEEITTQRIADAMSSFLITITSKQGSANFANDMLSSLGGDVLTPSSLALKLTPIENKGKNLFFNTYDCNACHQIQSPHGYVFAGTFSNIGLDARYADNGLEAISKRAEDNGKFKIPSLSNVALTAPYMHDGRFETLDEVLNHYSDGIADNPNLDTRLRENGQPMRMSIPDGDKKAIIAFLKTMTDHDMISDPKFSNPFKAR